MTDPTLVHDDNSVTVLKRGQTVRDRDDGGAALGFELFDLGLDCLFRGIIQRAGRLIQNQDSRFSQKDSSQRNALPLTARKVCAALGKPASASISRLMWAFAAAS